MGAITTIGSILYETADKAYGIYKTRREARVVERLKAVQASLTSRVSGLEQKLTEVETDPDKLNLFMITLRGLIDDDDEKKVSFYAAFLEELLTGKEDPAKLRLAGEAIRSLTSTELNILPFYLSSGPRAQSPPDWMRNLYNLRLQTFGLFDARGSVSSESQFTEIGRIARRICGEALQLKAQPESVESPR